MNSSTNKLPTGTVTFFFSDIEASTHLWEAHPQGADQLNEFWERGRGLTMDTAVDLALSTGGFDENGG